MILINNFIFLLAIVMMMSQVLADIPTSATSNEWNTIHRIDLNPAKAVGTWTIATIPDSTGTVGKSLYSKSAGDYVEYPIKLKPGWYDLYFWNLVYRYHQNPMKMTGTIHANNKTKANITLPINTSSADRGGRWDKIGTYYFAGGEGECFRLVSSGGEFARPADIKLEKNISFVPPPSVIKGETVFAFDTDFPIEATMGTFRVYVKGESDSVAQIDLTVNRTTTNATSAKMFMVPENKTITSGNYVKFNGGWQFLCSYKFNDFDSLNLMQNILGGKLGLTKVKFVHNTPDTIDVDDINLHNDSLGKSCSYLQAGYHTITANIIPINTKKTVMVLLLLEGGNLKDVVNSSEIDLTTGDEATLTARIPILSVSKNTVLKVMFFDSLVSPIPISDEKTYYPERKEKNPPFLILPSSFEDAGTLGTWSRQGDRDALTKEIAVGLTTPGLTKNAKIQLSVAHRGTCHLWVRSKNSTSNPNYFSLNINGTTVEKMFGQIRSNGFIWEDGGQIILNQGENEISVVDSSCHNAIFDGIYITGENEKVLYSNNVLLARTPIVSKYNNDMSMESMMTNFKILKDFPGGNVKVLAKNNNTVTIAPDLSDTSRSDWFYWNFKATSDIARHIKFKFADNGTTSVLNASGVAYSLDNGQKWAYLTNYKHPQREFEYTFESGQQVWFAVALPYVNKNLTDYLNTIKDMPRVTISTLCLSEKGRKVPIIVVGNPLASKSIVLTSRHHSCEATPSYLIEGAINYLISEANEILFNDYCFYIIPMVDIDGVENGEQGKGRKPHDHNRDYVAGIYAPVRAIKKLFANKHIEVALDFHSPYIPDKKPYLYLWNGSETEINKFGSALVRSTAHDVIYYDRSKDHADGKYYAQCMVGWFAINKSPRLSTSVELPYSGGEVQYYPLNIRAFGRKTMMALVDYLNSNK